MDQWCAAIQSDLSFRQQLDPVSGTFTEGDMPGYSPTALVMIDFTWRLAGVREEPDELHWNIRPHHPASDSAHFRLRTDEGRYAEMRYDRDGASLRLNGTPVARVEGGAARLVTDKPGNPVALIGISNAVERVIFRRTNHAPRSVTLRANQRVTLA
jgi:hypothetical protein